MENAEKMNRLSLCGIKHSGKSSVAAALAEMLSCSWADTDDALRELYRKETGEGFSVREIFQKIGASEFRKLEMRALRNIPETVRILALGGGTLSNENRTVQDLDRFGTIICLDVPDSIAFERIRLEGLPPFLQNEADPYAAFCKQNEIRRKVFFPLADIVIRPDPNAVPESTARQILERWKEKTNE